MVEVKSVAGYWSRGMLERLEKAQRFKRWTGKKDPKKASTGNNKLLVLQA